MKALLERLLGREDLTETEAGDLLRGLTDASTPDALKAGLLVALRAKGETGAELRGMAMAMRSLAASVSLPEGVVVDTCGTGGDGSSSFNISTAAALVLAASGLTVAKHGNRSVSSKCGSADVLEALGVPLALDAAAARAQLGLHGFTFLFAPAFHSATAGVGAVRRALGVRTAFNLLGPLSNPAAPTHQLVGAASPQVANKLATALAGMPGVKARVVHGSPSWDEATPCGPFLRLDVSDGVITEHTIDPLSTYGVSRCAPSDLAGGDAQENAEILRRVLAGEPGPAREAVLLNVALVLELVHPDLAPAEAYARAGEVIDAGRAEALLTRMATPA